jgi:hypothetical protein
LSEFFGFGLTGVKTGALGSIFGPISELGTKFGFFFFGYSS